MQQRIESLRAELHGLCDRIGRRVQIMEVCGTHTVSFFRSGLRAVLPKSVGLISGPGCPVCVTAQRYIDATISLAARRGTIITTYGDMMRVPGRLGSLERLRACGASIQVIHSARAALQIAQKHANQEVVFLAVGFETTAPATAATVFEAQCRRVENFSVLMCHKRIVPAMQALISDGQVPLDGFLCPGHVSVIIGAQPYRSIVRQHAMPCVIAGFETEQLLLGLTHLLQQVAASAHLLDNVYGVAVSEQGNRTALEMMGQVFVHADAPWRTLGVIPNSGLELRPAYRQFDALQRFGVFLEDDQNPPGCRCGEVIQGRIEPAECPLFARTCTPITPIGPCMVSSEGTCAVWYKYNRCRKGVTQAASRIEAPSP